MTRLEQHRRVMARRAIRPKLHLATNVWAKVGRNHPDYGMTVDEHGEKKAQRAHSASRRLRY